MMAQTGGVVRFLTEGDCILSSPRALRDVEGKPWLQGMNSEVAFSPQRCFTPDLNSRRIQVLRKSLTPEARRAHLGMYNSTGSLVCNVTETGHRPGRVTAPCSPLRSNPLYSPGSRKPFTLPQTTGHSSIVTFTFIKKSSVQTLNGIPSEPDSSQIVPQEGDGHREESCAAELAVCHKDTGETADVASCSEQRVGSPQPPFSPQGSKTQLKSESPQTRQKPPDSASGSGNPCSVGGSDSRLTPQCDSPSTYVNTSCPTSGNISPANNMSSSPSQSPLLRRVVGESNFCKDEVTSPIKGGSNEQSPRSPRRLDLIQQVLPLF